MTTQASSKQASAGSWAFTNKIPGATFFKSLKIGTKLLIGFGILVVIALLGALFSYLGSIPATQSINQASTLRFPTALDSSSAQADLLRMLGDMQSYLALGDQVYRDRYNQSSQAFEDDLNKLRARSANFEPEDQQRIDQLKTAFDEWKKLPDRLFELRNDQLEREPAYKILATDGIQLGGTVLINLSRMIDAQGRREPTADNIAQLANMAKFQGSFASMLSGLRGYVTTRNRIFKGEYEANLTLNNFAWDELVANQASLDPEQQTALAEIAKNREAFLELPDRIYRSYFGGGAGLHFPGEYRRAGAPIDHSSRTNQVRPPGDTG
ncbi:MAG: CHASE3 domain-containing protein [Chloroflexi bacterium]|nr:CHASE3 domain-containing protein [Chloroflexota bacterium]